MYMLYIYIYVYTYIHIHTLMHMSMFLSLSLPFWVFPQPDFTLRREGMLHSKSPCIMIITQQLIL